MHPESSVYMDHNATVSMSPFVQKTMEKYQSLPLNPSSIHSYGRFARSLLDDSRNKILETLVLNPKDYDLIFVSSCTEGNNLVLHTFRNDCIVISPIEHPSIHHVKDTQSNIHTLKIDSSGQIDLVLLESILINNKGKKILVSVMYANNETGVITNIKEITKVTSLHGAYFHTDASQVLGKIDFEIDHLVDFITISSHKCGGPLGIGAVVAKKGTIKPQIFGGSQEFGLRAGTENTIAAVGFSAAVVEAKKNTLSFHKYTSMLKAILEQEPIKQDYVICYYANRLPNTSMIRMSGVDSQKQLIYFDVQGFAVSAGAACSSGKISKSHVLEALGYGEFKDCIRVSLGMNNTAEQITNFRNVWTNLYLKSR